METNLQEAKLELIQWLAAIDDPDIIEQIQAIRDKWKGRLVGKSVGY